MLSLKYAVKNEKHEIRNQREISTEGEYAKKLRSGQNKTCFLFKDVGVIGFIPHTLLFLSFVFSLQRSKCIFLKCFRRECVSVPEFMSSCQKQWSQKSLEIMWFWRNRCTPRATAEGVRSSLLCFWNCCKIVCFVVLLSTAWACLKRASINRTSLWNKSWNDWF